MFPRGLLLLSALSSMCSGLYILWFVLLVAVAAAGYRYYRYRCYCRRLVPGVILLQPACEPFGSQTLYKIVDRTVFRRTLYLKIVLVDDNGNPVLQSSRTKSAYELYALDYKVIDHF